MKNFIAEFSRHHNVEAPPWRAFVKDHAEALKLAILDRYGNITLPEARKLFKEAKEKGKADGMAKIFGDKESPLVVWWEEDKDGVNFGVSESWGSHKSESLWIDVQPYKPDKRKWAKLMEKSKSQLIDRILRQDATS